MGEEAAPPVRQLAGVGMGGGEARVGVEVVVAVGEVGEGGLLGDFPQCRHVISPPQDHAHWL